MNTREVTQLRGGDCNSLYTPHGRQKNLEANLLIINLGYLKKTVDTILRSA